MVVFGRFTLNNKFSALPPKLKLILSFIVIVFALAIILSIPSLLQRVNQKNSYKKVYDSHSGQTIIKSNTSPEDYGIPKGTPSVIGTNVLIDRGISFDKSTQVYQVLAAYYQHKNVVEHSNVKLVSIGKDLSHYNDNGDTYAIYDTTIKLDDNNNLIPLRIKDLNDPNKYHFIIQLKLGDDYQTIYETNDDISQFVQ